VVWRLDRLGRSLRHLIDVAQGLQQHDVAFVGYTERIDTTTPGGVDPSNVRALAAFVRDLIRQRTVAGLAAAGPGGVTGDLATVWTAESLAEPKPCETAASTTLLVTAERRSGSRRRHSQLATASASAAYELVRPVARRPRPRRADVPTAPRHEFLPGSASGSTHLHQGAQRSPGRFWRRPHHIRNRPNACATAVLSR
jgi:hypothetical protein